MSFEKAMAKMIKWEGNIPTTFDIYKEDIFLMCSKCFKDEGLKQTAERIGINNNNICKNCNQTDGKKLNERLLSQLVFYFFVKGSLYKVDYGAAPIIQYNDLRDCEIEFFDDLKLDVDMISKYIKLGLFLYGPRLWMLGEIEPLKQLINNDERNRIMDRIINEYPSKYLDKKDFFYRIRINPEYPEEYHQFDSPPSEFLEKGRFDSKDLPVLYASQDIEVCIHECRVSSEDEVYMATLEPTKKLKFLDLTEVIDDMENEFESLDLAIHMLFFAGKYSYKISREIAKFIYDNNFDGIIYPSYFSAMRTGCFPFETIYGLSIRKIPQLNSYAQSQIIGNIALFGRPINDGKIIVKNLNKLILNKINYDYTFGPVKFC